MKSVRIICIAACLFGMLYAPLPAFSQDEGTVTQSRIFTKEQLAQMLAPIALYPDTLLSQILMASTYPLEVVEADRWVREHQGLSGGDLDEALKDKDWDASVQSLCRVPTVLGWMNDDIGRTGRLGDAFLAQEDDVMDMVQELRRKARDNGTLNSTGEQKVTVYDDTIAIEPAQPDVVYVPSYDPLYVYGPWWYPAYPPYYWGPVLVVGGFGFWPGVFVGIDIGYWSYFDWPRHRVHIDLDRKHHFFRGFRPKREFDRWQHEPGHRRGVAYRDKATAQRFGQSPLRPTAPGGDARHDGLHDGRRDVRRDVRGYPDAGSTNRQDREIRENVDRRTKQGGGATIRVVPGSGAERGNVRREGIVREKERDNAFSRIDEGRNERISGERGRTSRGDRAVQPPASSAPRSAPARPSAPVNTSPRQGGGDRRDRR